MRNFIIFILVIFSLVSCKSQDTAIEAQLQDKPDYPVKMEFSMRKTGEYFVNNDSIYTAFYLVKNLHIHNSSKEKLSTWGITFWVNHKLFHNKLGLAPYIVSIDDVNNKMLDPLYIGPDIKIEPETDVDILIGIPFALFLNIKEFEPWKNKGKYSQNWLSWETYDINKNTGVLEFLKSRIPKNVQLGVVNLAMASKDTNVSIQMPVKFE